MRIPRSWLMTLGAVALLVACGQGDEAAPGGATAAQPNHAAGAARQAAAAPVLQAQPARASTPQLFAWAQRTFPDLFGSLAPDVLSVRVGDAVYDARHYAATGAYLGVVDGVVHGLGPFTDGRIVSFGPAASYDDLVCATAACPPLGPFAPPGALPDYGSVIKSSIATPVVVPEPSPRASAYGKSYFGRYLWSRNVAIGDIDGDGLDDAVVVPSFFDQPPKLPIEIWLNQGDGRLANRTAEAIDGAVPTAGFATAVLIADFNNDGRADVFISDSGLENLDCHDPGCDGGVNVLLLSQPSGRLKDVSATHLPANDPGFNHAASSVGDLNGDGHLDIAVVRLGGPRFASEGVLVYLNQGEGRFRLASSAVVPDEINFLPFSVTRAKPKTFDRQAVYSTALADVDGDGIAELITGSSGYSDYNTLARTIRVFKWQAASRRLAEWTRATISPLLRDVQNIGFPGQQLPAAEHNGLGAVHLGVGDLDGDGRADLVVNWESWTENYAQLLLGRPGGLVEATGHPFNGSRTSYAAGGSHWTVLAQRIADVNGDGRADIVLGSGGNNLSLLANGSPAAAWLSDGADGFTPQRLLVQGRHVSEDDVGRFLGFGCTHCGHATYYGRFVPRAPGSHQALDMLLMTGSEDMRADPVRQENSVSLRVLTAR